MVEGLQHAGQYVIEDLRLVTTTGLEVDLKTSLMGITLFEDISSMAITGTISVMDSANLSSHGPLLGQEYLYLKIRTPFANKDITTTIDFSENGDYEITVNVIHPDDVYENNDSLTVTISNILVIS